MLKLVGTIAVLLFYPLGCRLVAAQLCSANPFVSLRPSGGSSSSVDCSQHTDDEDSCWDQPDCYYFDDSTQLPPDCATLPVYWPNLDQTMMVTFQDVETPVTIMGENVNADGPSAKYACIPASLTKSVLCYDGPVEYPDDEYLVLFGVPDGLDVLGIELTMQLTKSKYIATSVLGLSAESPNPLSDCIYKSLATSGILVSVESTEEYVVAIRLKRLANQSNINGDKVSITISSVIDPWPAGDDEPYPEPAGHFCPSNWAEAIETPCTDDQIGLCFYSFRYIGCTYEELECKQYYTCDCQTFLDKWRCWGRNEMMSCPVDSPTQALLGQSCDPRASLPKNPNPPPAVCPGSMQEAAQHSCDPERIQRCEYNFKWFGCFPGELVCEPNAACECNGQWSCNEFQHYCTDETRQRSSWVGTSCDPNDCPPEAPVAGRTCTTSNTCGYNYSYSGCDWSQLKCEPEKNCQCNNGKWQCDMRAEQTCVKPPGFPIGPCDPDKDLPQPSN